jgi:dTDP-4-amino-4,6-dideoxygalactose transaminase
MSQGRQVTVGDFKAGPKEYHYIDQVLRSGRLSYGPFGRRFEAEWAKAHGAKHAVFCNSGTSALHIAVQALKQRGGWRDGDEVIVPSVTFVATANVCLHNGLKPVFVDVDPQTYNINPLLVEEKVVPGTTRAIIPVHLCGQPADMPTIQNIAWRYGLSVIEDSCETAFADCHGKPVGSWGDVGCFSTYMAHYIVTGVGGLATTSDPELAKDLRSLMNHGRDGIYISIDDDNGKTKEELKEIISRRFKFIEAGHSFRCTELEAALGVAQLERRDEIVARRKEIATGYTAGLWDLQDRLQLPTTAAGVENVFMMYPLVTKTPEDKAGLVQHLEDHGIETRDLLPLLNQPVYHKLYGKNLIHQYPTAKRLDGCGFYIGTHQYITDDDVAYVVQTVRSYFGR